MLHNIQKHVRSACSSKNTLIGLAAFAVAFFLYQSAAHLSTYAQYGTSGGHGGSTGYVPPPVPYTPPVPAVSTDATTSRKCFGPDQKELKATDPDPAVPFLTSGTWVLAMIEKTTGKPGQFTDKAPSVQERLKNTYVSYWMADGAAQPDPAVYGTPGFGQYRENYCTWDVTKLTAMNASIRETRCLERTDFKLPEGQTAPVGTVVYGWADGQGIPMLPPDPGNTVKLASLLTCSKRGASEPNTWAWAAERKAAPVETLSKASSSNSSTTVTTTPAKKGVPLGASLLNVSNEGDALKSAPASKTTLKKKKSVPLLKLLKRKKK